MVSGHLGDFLSTPPGDGKEDGFPFRIVRPAVDLVKVPSISSWKVLTSGSLLRLQARAAIERPLLLSLLREVLSAGKSDPVTTGISTPTRA